MASPADGARIIALPQDTESIMAGKQHRYRVDLKWTGNKGAGTSGYTAYDVFSGRDAGRPDAFLGKPFGLNALVATLRGLLE